MNTSIDFIPQIQNLLIEIGALLERIEQLPSKKPEIRLRRQNQIKTIHSTCMIEGNSLSLSEVTAIIDGKRVKGDQKQIKEVQNAVKLYAMIGKLNPLGEMDFLLAHRILMKGIIDSAGIYRNVDVGISSNGKIKTVFPSKKKLKELCREMFDYILSSQDNYLVKSAIIHYLIESIHPFEDGNGRMGRFWQTLFLSSKNDIFSFLPLELLIRKQQADYYEALFIGQKADSPTYFVKFCLEIIKEALIEAGRYKYEKKVSKKEMRLKKSRKELNGKEFSRSDYLKLFPDLSASMASKDLADFVNNGILDCNGAGNTTKYRF